MNNSLKIYRTKDLDMVAVRKYSGEENGMHVWIFQGFDFVKNDGVGHAASVLEDTDYQYLPMIEDENSLNRGRYIHAGLKLGDIRIVGDVPEHMNPLRCSILPFISNKSLVKWIEKHPNISFVHDERDVGKVKKLGSR